MRFRLQNPPSTATYTKSSQVLSFTSTEVSLVLGLLLPGLRV